MPSNQICFCADHVRKVPARRSLGNTIFSNSAFNGDACPPPGMEEDGSMLRPDGDQPIGFGPTTFGLTTCGRFTALPVLIILHGPMSTPGRVGNALRAMGHPLDVRRPVFGDPLPETLDHYAGAITFGGPMSANDNEDFIRREIDWLAVPLKEQRPFLGICLGAQMLAKHLGAKVAPHPDGRAEVGYYPIRPTEHGRKICSHWPDHVYQWQDRKSVV